MPLPNLPRQPEVNIGTIGHVDHGKTTLIQALTGAWAARHSEELKRGITIKLGYADAAFRRCPKCPEPQCYTTSELCPIDGSPTELLRVASFIDAPGHEILMTTMLSGAAIMDGAILVIAANEPCPRPQTREHLAAVQIIGVKNIVVAQTKVDIVSNEQARENYEQIRTFMMGSVAEDAPIVPVMAQHKVNIDLLIKTLEDRIPTPKRDPSKPPRLFIVRSFDVNKPGTEIEDIIGGVLGGSVIQGAFEVGNELEIGPGLRVERMGRTSYQPLTTEIVSLQTGGTFAKRVSCGGLVALGTRLDPAITKADGLVGNVAGKPGELPPVLDTLAMELHLFERAVGTPDMAKVERMKPNEPLVLNVGTSVTSGLVSSIKNEMLEVPLKRPVCADVGDRVAVSRRIADKWRLVGYGVVKG